MPQSRFNPHTIETEEELRALIGEPSPLVCTKVACEITSQTRQFIERSPFVCVATTDRDGNCDVSPRGDPAGFVRVLDETTLLIPERPGNRMADSLRNIVATGRVGLLFLIPGVGDTFRVNGRARLITNQEVLEPSAIDGKVPKLGILVDVAEAYTQCSKAFIRSQLWDPANHVDRSELPSYGQIMESLTKGEIDAVIYDRERAERYSAGLGLY